MPPTTKSKRIFLAPAPRAVSDIFEESDLVCLRVLGELVVHEGAPVCFAADRSAGPSCAPCSDGSNQAAALYGTLTRVQDAGVDWRDPGAPLARLPSSWRESAPCQRRRPEAGPWVTMIYSGRQS